MHMGASDRCTHLCRQPRGCDGLGTLKVHGDGGLDGAGVEWLAEQCGEHPDDAGVGEENVVGGTEGAARFEGAEFGAELADADDFGDCGGEGGGCDEVFEGALGVFDDEADGGGGGGAERVGECSGGVLVGGFFGGGARNAVEEEEEEEDSQREENCWGGRKGGKTNTCDGFSLLTSEINFLVVMFNQIVSAESPGSSAFASRFGFAPVFSWPATNFRSAREAFRTWSSQLDGRSKIKKTKIINWTEREIPALCPIGRASSKEPVRPPCQARRQLQTPLFLFLRSWAVDVQFWWRLSLAGRRHCAKNGGEKFVAWRAGSASG